MVEIAGRKIKDIHVVGFLLVLLVGGYFGVWAATPGPALPSSPSDVVARTQVALGTATVATPDAEGMTFTVKDRSIKQTGQLFGTFEEEGSSIEPGESLQYCADVVFQSDLDVTYTYVGHYLSSADFDFANEGETVWSDYHTVGSTVTLCNDMTAPGGGTYSVAMYCDSISDWCNKIDEDTFTVEGSTDEPPTINDMNCQSTAKVGETVYIDPDVSDDTGISRYYWDGDNVYATSESISESWSSAGTKRVSLTVTDQSGQTDSASCTIDVQEDTVDPSSVSGNTVLDFLGSATAAVASLFS